MRKILLLMIILLCISNRSYANKEPEINSIITNNYVELSEKINRMTNDKNSNIVIVNEEKTSDLLIATTFAYKKKAALLLIKNDSIVDNSTLREAIDIKANNIYVVGGEKSISEEYVNIFRKEGFLITRIDGANRFEVSRNLISENMNINPTDTVVLSDKANFNYIQGKIGVYLKKGYAITFVDGKKYDEKIWEFIIKKGISNVIIDQPYNVISSDYDSNLKKKGIKVIRNRYDSVYDANYEQNSNINYKKILFTDYKDIKTTLLTTYMGVQKNYINIIVNDYNLDKSSYNLLSTSIKDGLYVGNSNENFTKLKKKLDLFYK